MFADDTNLFYPNQDISYYKLFRVVDSELEKVCDWFNANKLSLIERRKDKIYLFHRHRNRNFIPLKLAPLFVNKK